MKKALITTLQIAVTLFAFYWVFRDPKTREGMAKALHEGDFRWLIAAVAIAALPPICATIRWWLLLGVQGIHLTLKRAFQLYMVGMFFNLFLLGSTGGDAVKLFYLLREKPEPRLRAGAFLAVVMDRLVGMIALIILSMSFVLARYRWLTQTAAATHWVNWFLFILGSALVGIVVTLVTAQLDTVRFLPARMPGRKALLELALAIRGNSRAWRTSLACVAISFVGHMAMCITFYFAALVIHAAVAFWDVTVAMPIVNTYAALPVSLSGMGVRETVTTILLGGLCHLADGVPALISIVGFLCSVVFYGLLGGLFYLFYKGRAGGVPAHVEEIEAREEEAALPGIVQAAGTPQRTADA